MFKRSLLTFITLLTISGVLWAQDDPVRLTVKPSQGEARVLDNVSEAQYHEELGKFLRGSQDGTLELKSGEESLMFTKKGDTVHYEERKAQMTAEDALDLYWKSPDHLKLEACESNLKNLGTANEMYSTDYHGEYPADIGKLAPEYLLEIPKCPTTGAPYSYHRVVIDGEKLYEFTCTGDHSGLRFGKGYPRYNGAQGLVKNSYADVAKGAKEY